MKLRKGYTVWVIMVHQGHHLAQSVSAKIDSAARPCAQAAVGESPTCAIGRRTWAIGARMEKLEPGCEMLFGAREVTAPIAHDHLQHIIMTQNGRGALT